MTISEYIELFLMSRTEVPSSQADEKTEIEVSDLTSGSFVYPLFEQVVKAEMEIDTITQHLEDLYDSSNYFGLIYFIMFLADATGYKLPKQFILLSLNRCPPAIWQLSKLRPTTMASLAGSNLM